MGKLTLKLDELTVETFVTAPREEPQGTVRANETTTTRNQIMCDCQTWEVHSCDPNNCGGTGATNCGCGSSDCHQTDYDTCATGRQIWCYCG